MMNRENIRRLNIILYGVAIIISVFALYTFVFIYNPGNVWKLVLIIIGTGWLFSAISGFLKHLKHP